MPSSPSSLSPDLVLWHRARRGSAAAFAALGDRCRNGPPERRAATLHLLPGLLPHQPVWSLLDEAAHPLAPAPVRQAAAAARRRCRDPREREPAYRAGQRALTAAFLRTEDQRLFRARGRRAGLSAYLRAAGAVITSFYDYRFADADGCLYQPALLHIEEFLLSWAPRRLLVPPHERRLAPAVLAQHLLWLGRSGGILPEHAGPLKARCQVLAPRYQHMIDDHPHQPGPLRARVLRRLDLDEEFTPLWSDAPAP